MRKIIDTRTLVVVSSDFSHYGCYKDADNQQKISTALMRSWDSSVIQALIKKEWHQFQKIRKREGLSVCGNDALSLLLALYSYPETIDYKAQLLAYYSSYSITQLLQAQAPITLESLIEKNQDATISMGINYASMIYFDAEQLPHFTSYEKHALRYIAQKTLALSFTHVSLSVDELLPLVTPAICQKMGCFVTITDKNNVLRGCVGKIVTNEPLYETVMAMTQAAAFQDTRFDQITADEILDLNLEITIITEPRKVVNLNTFSPGRDGIILKKGEHEALFFPHVALENNWSKKKTLEELSLKAGLKPDEWKKGCSLELFSCITI